MYVPARDPAGIQESGQPAQRVTGVKFLRHENGYAVFAVGSGQYVFTVGERGRE